MGEPKVKDYVLKIRDLKTKQDFKITILTNSMPLTTRDGERIRVHPLVIKQMIKVGDKFDAIGVINNRPMRRIA